MKENTSQIERRKYPMESCYNVTTFLCVAVIMVFALLVACERPEPPKNPSEQIVTMEGPIRFFEFEPNPTACNWNDILYDNQIILINDVQTYYHYINCDKGYYPEIDFDSNNVVIWSGLVAGGSYFNTATIECVEGVVHIDLFFQENLTCVASEPWIKAFLLPKIPTNTTISVEVHVTSN